MQRVTHSCACRSYLAADVRKLGRCTVGYLILADDGGGYLFLKKSVCVESREKLVDRRFADGIIGNIGLDES